MSTDVGVGTNFHPARGVGRDYSDCVATGGYPVSAMNSCATGQSNRVVHTVPTVLILP